MKPEVLLHISAATVSGDSDEPGSLDGYGPVDAQTARELVGCASGFTRLLTDPDDGAVLSFGRTTYRVPKELRRYLQARDEVCRFVGCTRNVKYCDLDHSRPWSEDGETVVENLAHLCRGHHRLKERRRWRIDNDPGGSGVITWTSPTGRVYRTEPARVLPGRNGRGPSVGAKPFVQTEWLTAAADASPPFRVAR